MLPRSDNEVVSPPVDPDADVVWGLGRDIPSWVREWALAAEPESGGERVAPPWVLGELLRFGDVRATRPPSLASRPPAAEQEPDPDPQGRDADHVKASLPMSYARYSVRRADWFESKMSLTCSGRTSGVNSDDGIILDQIKDGDSLDTVIRMADEHRALCEWAPCPADEREDPELTVEKRAEVHLKWRMGRLADHDFAVLHRLDYQVWDAWLQSVRLEGARVIDEPPELLTRNGVSYEMALAAVVEAMADEMPDGFGVLYL